MLELWTFQNVDKNDPQLESAHKCWRLILDRRSLLNFARRVGFLRKL